MARGQKQAQDFIAAMNATAEKLAQVRFDLNTQEERFKMETDNLYAEEKALKEELMGALKTVGLSSVKVASGEAYSISRVPTFHFKNPLAEDSWAREHRCVRIDRTMLGQMLRKDFDRGALDTDLVEVGERETISIRKPKAKKEAEDDAAGDE